MAEKCICHINGYKVKDSTARAELAAQQTVIAALQEGVNELLEQGGSGGSSKRYLHDIFFAADSNYGVRMRAAIITDDAKQYDFTDFSYLSGLKKELLFKNVYLENQGSPMYGIVTQADYEDYLGFTVTISTDSEYTGSEVVFTVGGSESDTITDTVTEV